MKKMMSVFESIIESFYGMFFEEEEMEDVYKEIAKSLVEMSIRDMNK